MKRIFLLAAIAVGLTQVACQKDVVDSYSEDIVTDGVKVEISAKQGGETRTDINGGTVTWNSTDALGVYDNAIWTNPNDEYTDIFRAAFNIKSDYDGSNSAIFEGIITNKTATPGRCFYAVYPLDKQKENRYTDVYRVAVDNTQNFDANDPSSLGKYMFMVSDPLLYEDEVTESTNLQFQMHQLCTVLDVNITGVPAGSKVVRLALRAEDEMATPFLLRGYVNLKAKSGDDDYLVVKSISETSIATDNAEGLPFGAPMSNYVNVNVANWGSNISIPVVILPTNFSSQPTNLEIVVTITNGTETKNYIFNKNVNANFQRGVRKPTDIAVSDAVSSETVIFYEDFGKIENLGADVLIKAGVPEVATSCITSDSYPESAKIGWMANLESGSVSTRHLYGRQGYYQGGTAAKRGDAISPRFGSQGVEKSFGNVTIRFKASVYRDNTNGGEAYDTNKTLTVFVSGGGTPSVKEIILSPKSGFHTYEFTIANTTPSSCVQLRAKTSRSNRFFIDDFEVVTTEQGASELKTYEWTMPKGGATNGVANLSEKWCLSDDKVAKLQFVKATDGDNMVYAESMSTFARLYIKGMMKGDNVHITSPFKNIPQGSKLNLDFAVQCSGSASKYWLVEVSTNNQDWTSIQTSTESVTLPAPARDVVYTFIAKSGATTPVSLSYVMPTEIVDGNLYVRIKAADTKRADNKTDSSISTSSTFRVTRLFDGNDTPILRVAISK